MYRTRQTPTGIKHILEVPADKVPYHEGEDWESAANTPLKKRKRHSGVSATVWVVSAQVSHQIDIPQRFGDPSAAKRWEQYFAAQNPDNLEIIHFTTLLDSLALQRANSSMRQSTFLCEYSYFLGKVDLHRDDLPGDARLHKIPQSHLLLSTLTYEIFVQFFEPYVKKHIKEQGIIRTAELAAEPVAEPPVRPSVLSKKQMLELILSSSAFTHIPQSSPKVSSLDVPLIELASKQIAPSTPLPNKSVWVDILGPLVKSWVPSRQEAVVCLLKEGQIDPRFTPEISSRIKAAALAAIDARLSHHFWLMYSTQDRELYLYACSVERQFRIRALLAINHPLIEVVKTVFKYKRWDFIAGEIAKDHSLRGMDEFQMYFELRDAKCKGGRIVGGLYIEPSSHKSPITTWEF